MANQDQWIERIVDVQVNENDGDVLCEVANLVLYVKPYDRNQILRAFIASYENLDDVQRMVDQARKSRK